jgi:putative ABC transport system substrate-binding protein
MSKLSHIFAPLKRHSLFGALLFLTVSAFPSFSNPAGASEVVIVKDADIKPYRDAIQGFKSACACRTVEVDVSENVNEKIKTSRPDAIFVLGTQAFRKVRQLNTLPIVYTMVMPSETASVTGEAVFGISMDISPDTYFTTIAQLFPKARRIGLAFNPDHTGSFVEEAMAAAKDKGFTLIAKTMKNGHQLPSLLNELSDKIDLFWMLPDSTLISGESVDYLMLFSFQKSVPVFSFSKKYVERGAAAALAINPYVMGIQAAELLQMKSGNRTVAARSYARSPRLIVNRKVVSKLGVKINEEILKNAEQVE